jgi:hypothetical protein
VLVMVEEHDDELATSSGVTGDEEAAKNWPPVAGVEEAASAVTSAVPAASGATGSTDEDVATI